MNLQIVADLYQFIMECIKMNQCQIGNELDICKKHKSSEDEDVVEVLRDYCILNGYPLPSFELIRCAGTFTPTQFQASCSVGTVKRISSGVNKKLAKQNVATEVLEILESVS